MGVLPGMTEMVLSARSTLKVLNAETFPRSTNSVTYLELEEDTHKVQSAGLTNNVQTLLMVCISCL